MARNLMSGWAVAFFMSTEIAEMVQPGIELGYAAALEHVRDGQFDAEVRACRPDLRNR
jgi:hypothetical protein